MKIPKSVFGIALCLMLMGSSAARAEDAAKSPTAAPAKAEDHGTKDQAMAMVKKAIEYIKANGAAKAYAEFDKTNGKFIDRDLYVDVFSMDGKCLADGANSRLIALDLLDTEDADGKAFVRERVELAGTLASFWQNYKFANPQTHKIAPKETYCERLNDTVVCAGVYKN